MVRENLPFCRCSVAVVTELLHNLALGAAGTAAAAAAGGVWITWQVKC